MKPADKKKYRKEIEEMKNTSYVISEEDYLSIISLARIGATKLNNTSEAHKRIEEVHYNVGFKKRKKL